jgi:hypothetical protein
MTSFLSVPYADIISFIKMNNQQVPADETQAYLDSWNLIINNENIVSPKSVADFVIAYNLVDQIEGSPQYKASVIIFSPDRDLEELSEFLNLPRVNKERIIRILGYLDILDNDMSIYDVLPRAFIYLYLSLFIFIYLYFTGK